MAEPERDVADRPPVVLAPGEGRDYDMGPIRAVFKADGRETDDGYSISEWWLEPHTAGPHIHQHPEDDTFYVIAGTMSLFVDDRWIDAAAGSFVMIPGGTRHTFENRSSEPAAVLNFSHPGGFEPEMPGIVDWFRDNPPGTPSSTPSTPLPDRD